MNRVKLSIFTAIFIATALMFFSPCEAAGGKSELEGSWELVGERSGPKKMELSSKGTGSLDDERIEYKTENGRFSYLFLKSGGVYEAGKESYSYKVSGSTLTLTKDDGTILTYVDLKKLKPPSFTKFTDSRDGKVYKIVKMPYDKVWFAENLNYASEGSKCYNNMDQNCNQYGRLYDWAAAMEACPDGWRLPSGNEWKDLPEGDEDLHLKDKAGWGIFNYGTNTFGFTALPGGHFKFNRNDFSDGGFAGYWWGSSEDRNGTAFAKIIRSRSLPNSYEDKRNLYSVRCLQLSPGEAKSALAGIWVLVDGPKKDNPKDMKILSYGGTGLVDDYGIEYKTENDRFSYVPGYGDAQSYSYKVSDSTLTLTKDDGTILTYIAFEKQKPSFTKFTDSRDGKVYKTVKMPDGKLWFAENLNYASLNEAPALNDAPAPGKLAARERDREIKTASKESKCYMEKEENCRKYGRLYDWYTAMKACPSGWHLPSKAEWDALPEVSRLKAKEGWNEDGNGTDFFGFAALPGFDGGGIGAWWLSSKDYMFMVSWSNDYESGSDWRIREHSQLSVRCVKD